MMRSLSHTSYGGPKTRKWHSDIEKPGSSAICSQICLRDHISALLQHTTMSCHMMCHCQVMAVQNAASNVRTIRIADIDFVKLA